MCKRALQEKNIWSHNIPSDVFPRAVFVTGGRMRKALMDLIWHHRPIYPSVAELRELGTATYSWEVYKRLEATNTKDVHEDRQRVLQNKNLK